LHENSVKLEKTIIKLAEAKKYASLRDLMATLNPADLAEAMCALSEQSLPLVFRLLPKELAAETFVEMEAEQQAVLIRGFSDVELKAVVEELYVDDAVDLVEEMPANVVSRILTQADPDTRKMINEILQYPEDSAGSAMTTEFVELHPGTTAAQAIDHIRQVGVDKETINTCYVLNDNRILLGVVSIRALILADPSTPCEELMSPSTVSIFTGEDQETVAQMFAKYGFIAMPVVDRDGRMVGIVTMDDAMEILEEETTEDMEKMAAMLPSDRPYLSTGVFDIWKQRVPWLAVMMLAACVSGLIIRHFEGTILACTALLAYIPMLMDAGGNAGSQASVTVIRGLSIQELEFRDLPRVMWKELRVSLLCGLPLALVTFGSLRLLEGQPMQVSLAVSLALLATLVLSKLVGCTLPMLAEKVKFDPALLASPLITTIVDILALLIYFSFAAMLL